MGAASKTILLVEDNPSDANLAQRALKKAGIASDLVIARDGQEALDYLWGTGAYAGRDVSEMPALILLDLKIPKVHGLEVLRQVRADPRTRRLLVVILTTSNEERDIAAGFDRGVNSYICKPVDFKKFEAAVAQLGGYWLVLNEAPPQVK